MGFIGDNGSVAFGAGAGTAVANVISWTLTATCEVSDGTVMSNTYKDYNSGFKSWTAEVECHFGGTFDPDIATDLADSNGATLDLRCGAVDSSFREYTGTAIVTAIAPSVSKDDTVSVTYSFQGTGSLTEQAYTS